MKTFLAFFILSSNLAFASIPKIKAKSVTCQELKEAFASYHEVYVIYGLFGFSRATFWDSAEAAASNCYGSQRVEAEGFQTSDSSRCQVGYGCVEPTIDHCHGRMCND